jgi:hypothetical protein
MCRSEMPPGCSSRSETPRVNTRITNPGPAPSALCGAGLSPPSTARASRWRGGGWPTVDPRLEHDYDADILTCRDCCGRRARGDGGGDVGGSRTVWRQERRMAPPTAATWATRGTRRSNQITRDNFKNLQVAWRFKTDSLCPASNTTSSRRRSWSRASCTRRLAPGAPSWRSIQVPANCSGCTPKTRALAAPAAPPASFRTRARVLE